MFSLIPSHLPLYLRSPRTIAAVSIAVVTAVGFATYVLTRKRPSAEELERERRDLLAATGRITDGTIMDTMISESGIPSSSDPSIPSGDPPPIPRIIVYNYRIAGVTYECAQDVTTLSEYVRGIRSDLPIQVRYAPHNPANSIVVADTWSGLRLNSTQPLPTQTKTT